MKINWTTFCDELYEGRELRLAQYWIGDGYSICIDLWEDDRVIATHETTDPNDIPYIMMQLAMEPAGR